MDQLVGKVAVVTGGASGIGFALAKCFAVEGMNVVIADVEATALAKAAESLARRTPAECIGSVHVDVRDPAAVDDLADAVVERFGGVHVVCNNAGVAVGGMAWAVPAEHWRWVFDVNVLGVVNGIRTFVPRLIEQGEGHVVNTASIAGVVTGPALGPYIATKHAVVALSQVLRSDLGMMGSHVGVSVLCPAWVRTNIAGSERNRPSDVGHAEGANPPEVLSYIRAQVDSGIEASVVAQDVLEAIRRDQFWILTHAGSLATIRGHWQSIEEEMMKVDVGRDKGRGR
jgi:NAD(P)-dependent dehydrogenase (short-subunit alcohol dehydrogenase family)